MAGIPRSRAGEPSRHVLLLDALARRLAGAAVPDAVLGSLRPRYPRFILNRLEGHLWRVFSPPMIAVLRCASSQLVGGRHSSRLEWPSLIAPVSRDRAIGAGRSADQTGTASWSYPHGSRS